LADGGTLFLDEIGELPLSIQAELLRVVQEGVYKRVGSNTWHSVDFRLVCATNRDLTLSDHFRSDLYHRIACWQVHLPPLRERVADILPLFRFFARQCGMQDVALDAGLEEFLLSREYPGNVRDLRQLTTRICRRHAGGPLTLGSVPRSEWSNGAHDPVASFAQLLDSCVERALSLNMGLKETRKAVEEAMIASAVAQNGTLLRAAQRLQVTARALQLRAASQRPDATESDGHGEPEGKCLSRLSSDPPS
jgi:transcriptional regulator with GAF, ATPase, and Fis domain